MAGEVLTETNNAGAMPPNMDGMQVEGGNDKMAFINDIMNDPKKRMYAIIGVSVLAVLLIAFIFFASQGKNENRGKLTTLVQELNQAQAFEIVAKLKSVNIEAVVVNGDKPGEYAVEVYENAIETSYLTLSRTNLMDDEGYGLFDQNDWAASDYDKRIKLTRAINGDLSKIISRMDGLRSATVRVQVPEQQLFTELQNATTATVQVELNNEADELSKSQVKSIVNVLRGYVPNLEPDHISIVDTQGNNYSTFRDNNETEMDDYIDQVEKVNNKIRERIAKYLDAIIGQDDYKVSVSAAISREKIEQQQTNYTEGAVGTRQLGKENLASGGASSTRAGKNYQHETTNETLLPNFEQKYVTYLPGRVTAVTVALALDKSVPSMISLEQLQDSVAAIIGPQANAKNVKITIVDMHAKDTYGTLQDNIQQEKSWFAKMGMLGKTMTVIGIIALALMVGLVGLSFINSVSNRDSKTETDVDPNLGQEFEQEYEEYEDSAQQDFGEKEALKQQENLLREMMNQGAGARTEFANQQVYQNSPAEFGQPKQLANNLSQNAMNNSQDEIEFETLLNSFQSVATNKPDLLAKKIEVWLDSND
jgi:flagellar M-ring protein FliF